MAGMDCLCVASLLDLQEPVGTSDEEHKPAHEAKHEYLQIFSVFTIWKFLRGSQPAKVQEL